MSKAFSEEQKKELKREMIVVAKEFFSKRKFEDVKVIEITKKVGIAKGSFYSIFRSKEELLSEVLAIIEKEIHSEIISLFSESLIKKETLVKIIANTLIKVSENVLLQSFLTTDNIKSVYDNVSEETKRSMFEIDENLLKQLIGAGLTLKVDIDIAVDLLRSIFYLQVFKEEFQSESRQFNEVLVEAIIEKVFE
jgi:AcrR family transcriptional regulator